MAQRFLINPKRRAKARTGSGKRRRSAAQRAATARMLAANAARRRSKPGGTMAKRRKRKATAAPRRRRRRSTRRNPGILANPRRRRRATTRRRSAVRVNRRRRRSVRRNPSFGGAINMVTRGVKDAAFMVGGEMASNVVASYIPAFLTTSTAEGGKTETETGKAARKVIAAAIVGYLAQMMFRGGDAARLAVAGALAAPLKSIIRPILPTTGKFTASNLLSAYPSGRTLSAYPMPVALPPGTRPLSAYPARRGVGCEPDSGGGMYFPG